MNKILYSTVAMVNHTSHSNSAKYRILIVDDYSAVIESVKMMLEDIDHLVFDTASNGVEAMMKIKKFNPHLVILDAEMPGGNGDEVVRRLKENDQYRNIKIMGYTGIPYEGRYFEKLGVDKVIIKSGKDSEILNFQKEVCKLLGLPSN